MGGEFRVNTYTYGDQRNPSVRTDGLGNFVVVWDSNVAPGDTSSRSAHGRRYTAGAAIIFADGFESGDTSAWSSSQ